MKRLFYAIKLLLKSKFILILSLSANIVQAQKEDRAWCFPDHAGIDFNNLASPDTFTSAIGQIALGDQSTISDSSGSLFCYSAAINHSGHGLYIWDRNHNIMPNGSALLGDPIMTSILLSFPGNNSKICLFHIGSPSSLYNLYFSVISKNLNNGFGDVELRDSLIYSGNLSLYKLATIKHANGRDWWILIYDVPARTFNKFLLSPNGPSLIDSQTLGGSMCGNYGTMIFSRDGTKLLDLGASGCINVFDFDRCSGQLSNLRDIGEHLTSQEYQYFDGAFSPNGNVIYVSAFNLKKVFYQFDLNAPNIQASKLLLNEYLDTGIVQSNTYYNHLLAPDGKIYISRGNYYGANSNTYFTHHLDVIEYPDSVGLGCNYIINGFDLGSHFLAGYLPNMAFFGLGAETGTICDSLDIGINELRGDKNEIEAFPNPSTGIFSLRLRDANDKIISLSIEDVLGNEILFMKTFHSTFDISNEPSGVYFLKILTQHKNVFTGKLIKE